MKMIKIVLAVALCATAFLTSCASSTSTDEELRRAEFAVGAAEAALAVAEVAYITQMSDPSTSPVAKVAAEQVLSGARAKLADEKKRLADIRAQRAAAEAAAKLAQQSAVDAALLPALQPPSDLTATK